MGRHLQSNRRICIYRGAIEPQCLMFVNVRGDIGSQTFVLANHEPPSAIEHTHTHTRVCKRVCVYVCETCGATCPQTMRTVKHKASLAPKQNFIFTILRSNFVRTIVDVNHVAQFAFKPVYGLTKRRHPTKRLQL